MLALDSKRGLLAAFDASGGSQGADMSNAPHLPSESDRSLFNTALSKLSGFVEIDPSAPPDRIVRDVHAAWKAQGGALAGKPRHSDRYLQEQLKEAGTPVRSLNPKLTGKTRIRPVDAVSLIKLFLSQWPTNDEQEGRTGRHAEGEMVYKQVLPHAEIDFVAEFISRELESYDHSSGETVDQDEGLPGIPSNTLNLEMLRESDALIVVSPENTFVGPSIDGLVYFRDAMNNFWALEKADHKARPLIWVLDLGRRSFEDTNSRAAYINVQQVIERFKALRDFDDRATEERWTWLKQRVAIVLLDSRYNDEAAQVPSKRPLFSAHHVNFTAVAPSWLGLVEFRGLYGSNLERVSERSFSVFYSGSDWQSSPDIDTDLRYFGHALFAKDPKERKGRQSRGEELPSPGANYDDAFRTVCAAAAKVLAISSLSQSLASGGNSINQLSFLGYRVLKLETLLAEY